MDIINDYFTYIWLFIVLVVVCYYLFLGQGLTPLPFSSYFQHASSLVW